MTPSDPEALARDPKVREAFAQWNGEGGDTLHIIATLLTVLRESEGKVLDFEAARLEAQRPGGASFEYVIEAQAATRVAALRARAEELEKELNAYRFFHSSAAKETSDV